MKIAILGGSFDPPHLGHALVAEQVKQHLNIDQVWLMSCYEHPFEKNLSDPLHRLAMAKLLEDSALKASDFEIEQKKVSFTIDTLDTLSKKYPTDTFYWIIGSDQLKEFRNWKDWQRIIKDYRLIIYARDRVIPELEAKVKEALSTRTIPQNVYVLASENLLTSHISSTIIRQRVKKNLPIRSLVPKKIEDYIINHNLYK